MFAYKQMNTHFFRIHQFFAIGVRTLSSIVAFRHMLYIFGLVEFSFTVVTFKSQIRHQIPNDSWDLRIPLHFCENRWKDSCFCIFHGIGGRAHATKRVPQWSRPLVPVLACSFKACRAARLDKTALAAATPLRGEERCGGTSTRSPPSQQALPGCSPTPPR